MITDTKLLFAAIACFLHVNIVGQTFDIQVEEMFSKPEYLAINQTPDYLNLTGTLNSAFEREGFNVVNAKWASQQLQKPKPAPNHQVLALDIFNVFDRAAAVDPSLNPIKRNQLIKLLKDAGICKELQHSFFQKEEIEEGILECISQGAFIVLPKNKIALSTKRTPPMVEDFVEREWTPPTIYEFKFNYVYRSSLSCGQTIKEFYASLNDLADGVQIASVRFEQPQLSSMCKQQIINKCVSELMAKNHHEFKFQKSLDFKNLKSITIIGKDGNDCNGKSSHDLANDFSASILGLYNVVDRVNFDAFIEEQRNSMSGLFEDSDYIEAGRLTGAEGIVFVEANCMNKHTEIDISLSDTRSGSIQWSVHSENLDPHEIADRLIESMAD